MSIATDVRKRGEAVLEQGKAALDDARKPLYAVVGAGDFAVTQAVAQIKELPADTQAVVDSRVKKAQAQLSTVREELKSRTAGLRARASQLQGKARELPSKVEAWKPTELKATVEGYVSRAKEVYADLAERGEKVVAKVSERPGVQRARSRAENVFESVEDAVEDVVDAVTGEHKPVADRTPRKTAPRKTTAK